MLITGKAERISLMQTIHKAHNSPSSSHGILLLNTGTPDAPTPSGVRRFLAQMLSDRRVIDYPRWLWLPLLYGVILNVRPQRSARLYQRIWSPDGSPLLTLTRSLCDKLRAALAAHSLGSVHVEFAMRYGNPSIPDVLALFQRSGIERFVILPLFPQYSGTTTGTILEQVFETFDSWRWMPEIRVINDYHDHPAYINALVESICSSQNDHAGKWLFSFHGIPQRYVRAGDPYPAQCQRTASLMAEKLGLEPERWQVAFQSRFGPEEWTQPYTDRVLGSWGEAGVSGLRVICPGFAVDCLETLDEINHEGRRTFQNSGGGAFEYVPALNDTTGHVQALTEIILQSGNNL